MEKKNNWKWETLKKKVGSYFLLIDIASIFYTHEKVTDTYCHGNRLVCCQVLLIHVRYRRRSPAISGDSPQCLGVGFLHYDNDTEKCPSCRVIKKRFGGQWFYLLISGASFSPLLWTFGCFKIWQLRGFLNDCEIRTFLILCVILHFNGKWKLCSINLYTTLVYLFNFFRVSTSKIIF